MTCPANELSAAWLGAIPREHLVKRGFLCYAQATQLPRIDMAAAEAWLDLADVGARPDDPDDPPSALVAWMRALVAGSRGEAKRALELGAQAEPTLSARTRRID